MYNTKNIPSSSSKLPGVSSLARKRSLEVDQERTLQDNPNASPMYNIKELRPLGNTTKNVMSPLDLLQNITGESNFPPSRLPRRFSPMTKGKAIK